MNDGFLIHVQYTSTFYLLVVPCGEKFGGRVVVRVACHFSNKG